MLQPKKKKKPLQGANGLPSDLDFVRSRRDGPGARGGVTISQDHDRFMLDRIDWTFAGLDKDCVARLQGGGNRTDSDQKIKKKPHACAHNDTRLKALPCPHLQPFDRVNLDHAVLYWSICWLGSSLAPPMAVEVISSCGVALAVPHYPVHALSGFVWVL